MYSCIQYTFSPHLVSRIVPACLLFFLGSPLNFYLRDPVNALGYFTIFDGEGNNVWKTVLGEKLIVSDLLFFLLFSPYFQSLHVSSK
jgi:hypothetical protein